ncbi:MAG: hypothetical protein JNJ40_16855 [Bacteroidia bacterium]|nr:hypothetical protein [Bacteroidia bacterium]
MRYLTALLLFCFCNNLFCQKDSIIYSRHYKNGKLKKILYWHGSDTTQFIKFYKNGQIKDSSWFYTNSNNELPFGTSKSYYSDGRLSNITRYGTDPSIYTSISYWHDGNVSEYEVSPGHKRYYNKIGEIPKQLDLNKNKFIYIPKKYKTRRSNKIFLTQQKKKITIKNNTLISVVLSNDSNVALCRIDHLKNDSVYLSKFSYNSKYRTTKQETILNYDSSFVLSTKQLKTIYYSKHFNSKRNRAAMAAQVIGVELLVVSLITTAVAVREPSLGLPILGSTLVSGFGLTTLSKYLYKSMVPKKYDLNEWQIKLKD